MRALLPRLLVATALVVAASACQDPPAGEGEGEEGEGEEGEGDVGEGEGEGDVGEGEGEEGEGEGEVPVEGFDVTLDVRSLEPSLLTRYRSFAPGDCEAREGCVVSDGNRALLSVDMVLKNAGSIAVGVPEVATGTCTNATTLPLISARLVSRTGTVALEQDLEIERFEGLPVGERIALTPAACALLDITDVAPGDYELELALHSELLGEDVRPANDVVTVSVVVVAGLDCPATANICGGVCCPQNVACENEECALPDLSVDEEVLFDTIQVTERTFEQDACDIQEGCVGGVGDRRLLRFSTTTPNDGNADLVMGRPVDRPDLFSFSDCHGHFHFDQYADYRLLREDGSVAATGHKQAFCLIDLQRRDPTARQQPQFGCSLEGLIAQGISRGWADTYNSGLDCQWVDVTDVPEGNYILEVHVNPQHIFPELDLMNNVARVPVFIPEDPNFCVPREGGEVCNNARDDDCNGAIDDGCGPVEGADRCDNGFTLDGDGLVLGEIDAGNTSDSTPSCGGAGGEFVVHFNVAADGILYLSTYGSEIDTTLSVYRGADCNPTDEVLCVDDGCVDHGGAGGAHILESMTGAAYTAVIKAKNAGDTGRVQLRVDNAGCANAEFLADAGEDADVLGDVGDLGDTTRPTCAGENCAGGKDQLWYFATCPGTTPIRLTTCGPGVAEGDVPQGEDNTRFDSMLELRNGGCLGFPVRDTCTDDVVEGRIQCSEIETDLQGVGAGDGLWFALVDGCGAQAESRGGFEMHLTQE